MSSLRPLLDHRWSIPVLAELQDMNGARFVPLAYRVGAGRQSLRRSLDSLIAAGLVAPHTGYGHPSRPEYVLTTRGGRVAPACRTLLRVLDREEAAEVGLRRWTLPLLLNLERDQRFSDLKSSLSVTPAALAASLKELTAAGLVARTVHDAFPPHASYRATTRGRTISQPAERLACALV